MFYFNTFTAEFNILHSSFRIHIIGKRFYTCTFSTWQTNCYTLLLFISFDTWTSTLLWTEKPILHSILTRRISPVIAWNFKLNVVYFQLIFWIFVYSSVTIARDKRSLCGSGRWRPFDLLPRLFRQATSDFHPKPKQNTACSVKT